MDAINETGLHSGEAYEEGWKCKKGGGDSDAERWRVKV